MDGEAQQHGEGGAVILYDGVCGLCNRFVRFVAARDGARRFRFAPLQRDFARAALLGHDLDPARVDSLAVITTGPTILLRARAVLYVLRMLGGGWRVLAICLSRLPARWLGAAYGTMACERYRALGRLRACPAPPPKWRDRFID